MVLQAQLQAMALLARLSASNPLSNENIALKADPAAVAQATKKNKQEKNKVLDKK